jgi:hypothetical protein
MSIDHNPGGDMPPSGLFSFKCLRCYDLGIVFECRCWPQCDCATGMLMKDCPGKSVACSCQKDADC